jgi:hypothetical protein
MDSQNTDPNLKTDPNKINDDTPTIYGPQTAVGFDDVYKDIDNISNMPLDTKKEVEMVLQKGWAIMRARNFKNKNLIDLSILQITNINTKMITVFDEAIQKIKAGTFNQYNFNSTIPSVTDLKNAAEPYYDILLEILKKMKNKIKPLELAKINVAVEIYKNEILKKTGEYTTLLYSKKGGISLRKRKGKRRKTVKKRGRRTLRKGKRNGKRRRDTRKY